MQKHSDKVFRILAPVGGYEEGVTYRIDLYDSSFVNVDLDSENTFFFTVKREQIVDVQLKENVKQIQDEIGVEFQDENIIKLTGLDGTSYSDGDILIIPIYSDDLSEISLKIANILSQTSNQLVFVYELPNEQEVVNNADIYYNTDIDYLQSGFYTEWEEDIKQNVLQTAYVKNMHEIANEVYNAKNSMPVWTTIIPQIKVKVITYSPLEMTVEIVWTSENIKARNNLTKDAITGIWDANSPASNTPKFEVKIEIGFKNDSKAFVSEKNGVRNTSTVDSSTTSLKVTIGASYKLEVLGAISDKYQQTKYDKQSDNFSKEMQPYLDEASKQLSDNVKPGDYTGDGYSGRGRPTNELRETIAKENAAIDASNAKILAARDFINNNGLGPEKSNKEIFTLKLPPIALGTPAVTLSFEIGLYFDISINAEIGTQHIWKTTIETGTIERDGDTQNYHNEIKEYTGNVNVNGTVEAEVGVRAKAYFTFIGIVQIGVKAEMGLYFKAGGMYSNAWGDGYINGVYNPDLGVNNPAYNAKPWAAYYDIGVRFSFTGYIKFLIFAPWEYTFFEQKYSFFGEDEAIGQKTMFDLISEPKQIKGHEYASKEMTVEDLPVITISEDGYADVPDIYRVTYKIMENDISVSNTPLASKEYEFGFSNYVYFSNGKAYLKDTSVQEFEDVVYAYLIVDGEVTKMLSCLLSLKEIQLKLKA